MSAALDWPGKLPQHGQDNQETGKYEALSQPRSIYRFSYQCVIYLSFPTVPSMKYASYGFMVNASKLDYAPLNKS